MNEVIKHEDTGFNFNTTLSYGDHKEMNLIGIGSRYKLFFVVYGVGYYDSDLLIDKSKIFDISSTKGLVLQFYRNVTSELFNETLKSSILSRNDSEEIINNIMKLQNILKDITKINYKDIIHIIWENSLLSIYYNNKLIGEINSNLFAEIVFKCYLDKDTVITGLL